MKNKFEDIGDCPDDFGDFPEDPQDPVNIRRKCIVIGAVVEDKDFTLNEALKLYNVTREQYFTEEARIMNSNQGMGEQFDVDWTDLDPEYPSQVRGRCSVVQQAVEGKYFTLEKALKLYQITQEQYDSYLKNK